MKTQRELIKEALKLKNKTAKQMCEDLGFNYRSYKSRVGNFKFTVQKSILISEYLDIDLKDLIISPLDKLKKKDEINND